MNTVLENFRKLDNIIFLVFGVVLIIVLYIVLNGSNVVLLDKTTNFDPIPVEQTNLETNAGGLFRNEYDNGLSPAEQGYRDYEAIPSDFPESEALLLKLPYLGSNFEVTALPLEKDVKVQIIVKTYDDLGVENFQDWLTSQKYSANDLEITYARFEDHSHGGGPDALDSGN